MTTKVNMYKIQLRNEIPGFRDGVNVNIRYMYIQNTFSTFIRISVFVKS